MNEPKIISISIPPYLDEMAAEIAPKLGLSKSEYVARAILSYNAIRHMDGKLDIPFYIEGAYSVIERRIVTNKRDEKALLRLERSFLDLMLIGFSSEHFTDLTSLSGWYHSGGVHECLNEKLKAIDSISGLFELMKGSRKGYNPLDSVAVLEFCREVTRIFRATMKDKYGVVIRDYV